jgi:hypothetical protein
MDDASLKPTLECRGVPTITWISNAAGGDLHQRTSFDQILNAPRIVQKRFVSFWVREDEPNPISPQLPGDLTEVHEEVVRHLKQQVLPPIADGQQIALTPSNFNVWLHHYLCGGVQL